MGKKSLEKQLLEHLEEPKAVRDHHAKRKWTHKAIKTLVAKARKYKRMVLMLQAEQSIYRQLEAACQRAGGSVEIEQLLTMLSTFRVKALTGDPTRVDALERKRIVQAAILRMEAGESMKQIAASEGIHRATLDRWLQRYRAGEDRYQKGEARRLIV